MVATIWRVQWPGQDGQTNTSRVRALTETEAIAKARHCFKIPPSTPTTRIRAVRVQSEGTPLHKTQKQIRAEKGSNLKQKDRAAYQSDDPNPFTGTRK